jgi:hypothetical protein
MIVTQLYGKPAMTRTRFNPLTLVRLAAVLAVLLLFAGCTKEAAPVAAVAAPLHAPKSMTDDTAWKAYFQDVIGRNDDGVTDRTNAYYLPAPGGADYDGKYTRQLQGVQDAVARGVLPGNMLAFMSPDSTKMADLIVAAFKDASAGSMKKVVILFVGKSADNDRVKTAVANTGAIYRFVEAK